MTVFQTLACAGVIAATAACGSGSPDYAEVADDALTRANLDDVDTRYDDGVVHLTGTVETETQRQEAGTVVAAAVGTGAQVANEVTVEGGDENSADDLDGGLKTRVENLIEQDPGLRERNVDIAVVNGVVTLTGQVASAAEKTRLTDLARGTPGVRDVVDSTAIVPGRP